MDIKRARELMESNLAMMEAKNKDYSDGKGDNISATGVNGVAVRLLDKVTRLNSLTSKEGEPNFEGITDTLNDICNYALIGRMLEDGSWEGKKPLVYLAGPIDNVSEEMACGWRKEVVRLLHSRGVSCFNPVTAYSIFSITEVSKQVVEIDRAAVATCDIMLANLSAGSAFGTIREIEYAKSLNKRVIIVGDIRSAFSYDLEIYRNLVDGCNAITGAVPIIATGGSGGRGIIK